MERHLGRFLKKGEVVHHKNDDTGDNRLENLELFENQAAHARFHKRRNSPGFQPEIVAKIREMADDPTLSVQKAADALGVSHGIVNNCIRREGIQWRTNWVKGRVHPSEHVEKVLAENTRAVAARILDMTPGTLWRWYPEEMRKTSSRPELRSGATEGATAAKHRLQKRHNKISVAVPMSE